MGPPASGKSTSFKDALKALKESDRAIVEINVDDLVNKNKYYRKEIKNVQTALVAAKQCPNQQSLPALCEPADEDSLAVLCQWNNAVYGKYRIRNNPVSDSKLLAELVNASDNAPRPNVIYETTGRNSSIQWVNKIADLARKAGYKPIIVYPVVSMQNLWIRAVARAEKDGRLPCKSYIEGLKHEAEQNLLNYIDSCINKGCIFEHIFVFDNNATATQLALHLHKQSCQWSIGTTPKHLSFLKKVCGQRLV